MGLPEIIGVACLAVLLLLIANRLGLDVQTVLDVINHTMEQDQ